MGRHGSVTRATTTAAPAARTAVPRARAARLLAALLLLGAGTGACRGGAGAATGPSTSAPDARTATVTLETPAGRIEGSLVFPPADGPVPVALLIAGSGATDRDGNSTSPPLRNDALRLLAGELASRGVGSLRYDKRGVAASRGAVAREEDLRFDDYVADAVGWLRLLLADPRVSRVVVIGHSEGALVGTLAAHAAATGAAAGRLAVVTLAGAGRPASAVLDEQLAAQLPPPAMTAARRVIAELSAGRTVWPLPPEVPADVAAALFRPSVQPYLVSWFRHDPADALAAAARVVAGVLVVQGTTDLQVTVADAERLASAVGARPALFPGMNHVLRLAPADRAANAATYADPTLPLAPGLADTLARVASRPR